MPKKKVEVVKEPTYVDRERQEIEDLTKRIIQHAPAKGQLLTIKKDETDPKFSDMPISKLTLKGLARGNYETMTEIQRQAIPHALAGRDILGAARTGSGKTLAFLIPLIEDLFREQWSREVGVGGLVISPTRELALQIYEVLRVILHYHTYTCGLLVGGADFEKDQRTAWKSQVIICTPGRLLQHLEQTPNFDLSSTLRVLVLDEADRLLDMGFKDQLEAIIGYLPASRDDGGSRQTMLFSATQTKSLKDLARLSLRDPEYVAVHAKESTVTPVGLRQLYVQCQLGDKIDLVFSFIKSHLRHKTIMFFSSCKQVKFMEVAFRRMRPGVPVMALHGKQTPGKRTFIYEDFCSRPAAVLFATDVAARGLDFPNVDWVVQVDCPEDVAAYIHRVGRTARYNKNGNALLVLLPSEETAFLSLLDKSKIPIKRLGVNPLRKQSIRENLRSLLIADPELKMLAQKAFKSYLRSVHLQTNVQVFDVGKLSFKEFSASLGLASAPRIKFSKQRGEAGREESRTLKNRNYELERIMNEDSSDVEGGGRRKGHEDEEVDQSDFSSENEEDDLEKTQQQQQPKKRSSKIERMLKRKPMASRVASTTQIDDDEEKNPQDDESDDEFLRKKKPEEQTAIPVVEEKPKKFKPKPVKFATDLEIRGTKMRPKLQLLEDDDDDDEKGEEVEVEVEVNANVNSKKSGFVEMAAARLQKEDVLDRALDRKRVQENRKERKAKLLKAKQQQEDDDEEDEGDEGEERVVTLGRPISDSNDDDDEDSVDNQSSDDRASAKRAQKRVISSSSSHSKSKSTKKTKTVDFNADDMESEALKLIEKGL